MKRFIAPCIIVLSAVGCVESQPITQNQACPCAPGWACDEARNVCIESPRPGSDASAATDAGGTSDGASTCGAVCGDPGGTVASFGSMEEIYAALEGRWQICSYVGSWQAPADTIGVEFGPGRVETAASRGGGKLYFLVNGPTGPERGVGFDYQLEYDVVGSPQVPQLDVFPQPNSAFFGSLRYSPCPREFQIVFAYQNLPTVLVPLGHAPVHILGAADAGEEVGP